MVNFVTVCMLFVWLAHQISYTHGLTARGCHSQSSVLPPTTTVKQRVKGQKAKIIKVKGQT